MFFNFSSFFDGTLIVNNEEDAPRNNSVHAGAPIYGKNLVFISICRYPEF